MLMRRYEMPWRRAYETYAGAIWLMAMTFFAAVGLSVVRGAWMPPKPG